MHNELELHEGLIMVGRAGWGPLTKSPKTLGAATIGLHVIIADVDEQHSCAKRAGAKILSEPETKHGQRYYRALTRVIPLGK